MPRRAVEAHHPTRLRPPGRACRGAGRGAGGHVAPVRSGEHLGSLGRRGRRRGVPRLARRLLPRRHRDQGDPPDRGRRAAALGGRARRRWRRPAARSRRRRARDARDRRAPVRRRLPAAAPLPRAGLRLRARRGAPAPADPAARRARRGGWPRGATGRDAQAPRLGSNGLGAARRHLGDHRRAHRRRDGDGLHRSRARDPGLRPARAAAGRRLGRHPQASARPARPRGRGRGHAQARAWEARARGDARPASLRPRDLDARRRLPRDRGRRHEALPARRASATCRS